MRAFNFREVQEITQFLHKEKKFRDLALFRLGIDTMLRASDLTRIWIDEITDHNGQVNSRVKILMKKTGTPVHAALIDETRIAVKLWLDERPPFAGKWLFPGRHLDTPITEQQYRKLLKSWTKAVGLDPRLYSTHSVRRTKATHLYREHKDIKAVKELLGHQNTAITERYIGVSIEDAISLAEKVKI